MVRQPTESVFNNVLLCLASGRKATVFLLYRPKVSKGAKIRNRYNQVPHPTQGINGKVTNSQPDTTNESQEVSPFPAGDHKAHINRRADKTNYDITTIIRNVSKLTIFV